MAAIDAKEFLTLLFGHQSLAGLYLSIWDRQTHHTHAFQLPAVEDAANDAVARAGACDVYFGCCPYVRVEPGSRGEANQAGALVGLWLDVDVKNPSAHKGEAYPETDEQAFDLIYDMPRRPTLVVHSGYGLQAWWVFREPLLLRTPADRIEAGQTAAGWVAIGNRLAARHGWQLDKVGELARVLRVPGTWNRKTQTARPVKVEARKAQQG